MLLRSAELPGSPMVMTYCELRPRRLYRARSLHPRRGLALALLKARGMADFPSVNPPMSVPRGRRQRSKRNH